MLLQSRANFASAYTQLCKFSMQTRASTATGLPHQRRNADENTV
jgi:hypothetical protein